MITFLADHCRWISIVFVFNTGWASISPEAGIFARHFGAGPVVDLAQAPLSGEMRRTPWSLIRPIKRCADLAVRGSSIPGIASSTSKTEWEAYSALTNWNEVSTRVQNWSVAEKYDLAVGDFGFSLTQFIGRSKSDPGALARGWAAAALRLSPATEPVSLESRYPIRFRWSIAELHSLIAYHWSTSEISTVRLGSASKTPGARDVHSVIASLLPKGFGLVIEWGGAGTEDVILAVGFRTEKKMSAGTIEIVLDTLDIGGIRDSRSLEYRESDGRWVGPTPRVVWAPVPSATLRDAIDRFSPAFDPTNPDLVYSRWAAAASRNGVLSCSALAKWYRLANAGTAYPCESSTSM